jgi:hypothetical protein
MYVILLSAVIDITGIHFTTFGENTFFLNQTFDSVTKQIPIYQSTRCNEPEYLNCLLLHIVIAFRHILNCSDIIHVYITACAMDTKKCSDTLCHCRHFMSLQIFYVNADTLCQCRQFMSLLEF